MPKTAYVDGITLLIPTIRHVDCEVFLSVDCSNKRCNVCSKYRTVLLKQKHRLAAVKEPDTSSHVSSVNYR